MGWFSDTFGGGSSSNTSAGTSPQDSAPDYGAFSVQGLTSSDQANYNRNQAAAANYAAIDAARESQNPNTEHNNGMGGYTPSGSHTPRNNGIASIPHITLPNTGGTSGSYVDSEVGSLISALSAMPMFSLPSYGSYGSAFQGTAPNYDYQSVGNPIYGSGGGSNFSNMNLSDVFAAYPGLLPSAPNGTGE